jgi:RHS repeat-associated protein
MGANPRTIVKIKNYSRSIGYTSRKKEFYFVEDLILLREPLFTILSKFYDVTGVTNTKHLYAGDTLVATIETNPADEIGIMGFGEDLGQGEFESFGCCQEISFTVNVPHYVHTDHLMGTNVVTDKHGVLEETLDYYPYGDIRVDESTSDFKERHKFVGEFYDESSELSYLNSRYLSGKTGQFLSQDPSFLDIGSGKMFESKYERTLSQHLTNPQALNSYSYAHNNPITNKDPEGEILPLLALAWAIAEIGISIYDGYNAYQTANDPNASTLDKSIATGGFVMGLLGPGGGYGTIGKFGARVIQKTDDFSKLGKYAGTNYGSKLNEAVKQFSDNNISLTEHALERIVVDRASLGINPSNVIDTYKKGDLYFDNMHQNFVRFKDGVRVSIDENGTIRTVVKDTNFMNKTNRFKKVEN